MLLMNTVCVVKTRKATRKGGFFCFRGWEALPICKEKACNLTYLCLYVKIIQFSLHIGMNSERFLSYTRTAT